MRSEMVPSLMRMFFFEQFSYVILCITKAGTHSGSCDLHRIHKILNYGICLHKFKAFGLHLFSIKMGNFYLNTLSK